LGIEDVRARFQRLLKKSSDDVIPSEARNLLLLSRLKRKADSSARPAKNAGLQNDIVPLFSASSLTVPWRILPKRNLQVPPLIPERMKSI